MISISHVILIIWIPILALLVCLGLNNIDNKLSDIVEVLKGLDLNKDEEDY
jgi:hypothetical protein